MKKLNSKGFALVETLIVSVFVMGIFTLLYTNFYPLIGEYEKREGYDNIDSVYKTDLIKRFLSNNQSVLQVNSNLDRNPMKLNCTEAGSFSDECNNLMTSLGDPEVYITNYKITELKKNIDSISLDSGLKEYIKYLPNYEINKYDYNYRIIAKYKKDIKEGTENTESVYEYATLGVDIK